jgi:nucleoside-diphosphate-sugar epimerase
MKKIVETHYNRIDKAKRDFGWEPRVGIPEAQARTIAYGRALVDEIRAERRH